MNLKEDSGEEVRVFVVDGWSRGGIIWLGWSDIQLISFRLALSLATMCELKRWLDRENGMDRGWICG